MRRVIRHLLRTMTSLFALLLLAQAPETVRGATFEKTNKPSGLMPEHQRVAAGELGKLDIVSIPAWEKLFAVEPQTQAACVTQPAAALHKALKAKGLPKALAVLGCPDAT